MQNRLPQAVHLVFVGYLLSGQRPAYRVADLAIDLFADHFAYPAAGDAAFRVAIPVGIAFVGVLVNLVGVDVTDQDGNGVVDQAQALFAAAQGSGDAGIFGVGAGQVGIGVFQLGGTAPHALFELDVLIFGQVFDITLFGDVAVKGDKALIGQRFAAQQQNAPVRALAFGDMRRKAAGGGNPFGNLAFDVTRAVFATRCVKADETLEGRTDVSHRGREVEQAQEGFVPRHQAQCGIEHGDALIKQVEPGLQHFVTLCGVGRWWREFHQAILVQAGSGLL